MENNFDPVGFIEYLTTKYKEPKDSNHRITVKVNIEAEYYDSEKLSNLIENEIYKSYLEYLNEK